MKQCTKCGEIKEFSEFNKNKSINDGFSSQCKNCINNRNKELKTNAEMQLKKSIAQSIFLENKILKKDGKRVCSGCKNIFEITSTSALCKECNNKIVRTYEEKNKEKTTERQRKYYKKNKEKVHKRLNEHYENNKETILEQQKQYREKNKDKLKEYRKQYRLKKKLEKELLSNPS